MGPGSRQAVIRPPGRANGLALRQAGQGQAFCCLPIAGELRLNTHFGLFTNFRAAAAAGTLLVITYDEHGGRTTCPGGAVA